MFVEPWSLLIFAAAIAVTTGLPHGPLASDVSPLQRTPAIPLDDYCRILHDVQNETTRFSKDQRHVFWEAEFRFCDSENRPFAEEVLKCLLNETEAHQDEVPGCNFSNLKMHEPCEDVVSERILNCTFVPQMKKCGERMSTDENLDRLGAVLYHFETRYLGDFYQQGTCGWKVTQTLDGARRALEMSSLMASLMMGIPIKK